MNFFNNFTQKLTRNLAISIFLAVYLVVFFFLFTGKGIYINGHFYKKSANLTQITYSASSIGADFDQIVLEKFIDKSIITIDNKYTVSVFSSGSFSTVASVDSSLTDIDADWVAIAEQRAETMRGFGKKPWFAVAAFYIVFFVSKKYNVQLYSFFRKGKAAGENYYRIFDTVFSIFCILALVYLIIPF